MDNLRNLLSKKPLSWLCQFGAKRWEEVEPIINHGIVALVLLLIASGLSVLVEVLLPSRHEEIENVLKATDITILAQFGAFTIACVSIRMFNSLRGEYHKGKFKSRKRRIGDHYDQNPH